MHNVCTLAFGCVGWMITSSVCLGQGVVLVGPPMYAPLGGPTIVVARPMLPPVIPAPMVTASGYSSYRAIVPPIAPATYYAPAPFVPYQSQQVYSSYFAPVVPRIAPAAVVRPKVYIPGQPVRNVLRAVTP